MANIRAENTQLLRLERWRGGRIYVCFRTAWATEGQRAPLRKFLHFIKSTIMKFQEELNELHAYTRLYKYVELFRVRSRYVTKRYTGSRNWRAVVNTVTNLQVQKKARNFLT